MRILQIISHYVPAYRFGGPLQVAHALGKSLVGLGHEVRVCTTSMADPDSDLDVPLDRPVEIEGISVRYHRVRALRHWGFAPRLAVALWRETAWADVVLIHFHYQYASVIGGWMARLRRRPYIVFSHGSLNRYGVEGRRRLGKLMYLRLMEAGNFRRARFVAYHSEEERDFSLQFGATCVVPNGIAPSAYAIRPRTGELRKRFPQLQDRIVFLYLGRLARGKGLDVLLSAFAAVSAERDDVHLLLVGGEERGYGNELDAKIRELALGSRVTLTGLLSGQEKIAALQDADCYVLPSRSEGMSIAMLEAMYFGLPIITTDRVGLCRRICESGCGRVISLNEATLADALRAMAAHPDRRGLGRIASEIVKAEFTWDQIAGKLTKSL